MERRAKLFEAPEMGEIVELKLVEPLPETCYITALYTLEGTVKLFGIGALPWVYVEVKKKDWAKPEAFEEVSYERGLPKPISGKFSIDLTFDKVGSYEVTVVATPAPLTLPVIGVSPVVGRSDKMEIEVEEPPPPTFRFSAASIDGQMISLTNHDADAMLLMRKSTADYLEIVPAFEWTGVRKKATISIKAGFRDFAGTFAPKTGAITKSFTLPDSPFTVYEGELEEPIKIPLTACGDIDDGAIEIVAKLPDMPDYITHIWNVYATKIEKDFRFAGVKIDGQLVPLEDHDADSGLLLKKTTADHLEINPVLEWQGPAQRATISVKAGYKDWAGAFTPKTGAYTRTITLPESPEVPYESELEMPISIPLVACGGLTDGAIEIVLKITGFPDYISRIWNVYATEAAVSKFRFSVIVVDGRSVSLTDHDADSGLLLKKTTADSLQVTPAFEWQGSKKSASISIKAGYRDFLGGFTPKTGAYTATFELPESPETPYSGQLTSPISIPLTACADLGDGAIEVVLKVADMPDYITRVWNVYTTKAEVTLQTLEVDITPTEGGYVTTEPKAKEGHPEDKWYNNDTGKFDYGIKVRVTAHPNTGYKFDHWSDEIEGGTSTNNPENVKPMTEHRAVKAHFREIEIESELLEVKIDPSGAGYVTVTPEPESGTEHNWYFPHGTTVHVTAHPNPGYKFKSWSGEMTDTTAITAPVYPMTEKRTITAHFEKEVVGPPKAKIDNVDFVATKGEYSIGDSVPFTCRYDYEGREQGGQLLLELGTGVAPWFTPVIRYAPMEITLEESMQPTRRSFTGHFQLVEPLKPGQLYNTRAVLKAVEEYTEDMATDWSVIRITEVALEYSLTAIASPSYGGSVSGAGKYSAGTSATLYATPASGYEFDHWGGDASGTSRSTSVYMDRDKSVTAYFKAIVVEYSLTTSVYPSGAGTVTGAGTYRAGIYATLYATPGADYEFDRWSGDATGISRSVRVYMDRDKRAVANFKKKVVPGFTLTVLMSPTAAAGWVRKEPDKASYTYGETVKLTATSASGYRFSYWTVNGQRAGYSSTLTLMVTTDLEVIAYYTEV